MIFTPKDGESYLYTATLAIIPVAGTVRGEDNCQVRINGGPWASSGTTWPVVAGDMIELRVMQEPVRVTMAFEAELTERERTAFEAKLFNEQRVGNSRPILAQWWEWAGRPVRKAEFHTLTRFTRFAGQPRHTIYRVSGDRLTEWYHRTCTDWTSDGVFGEVGLGSDSVGELNLIDSVYGARVVGCPTCHSSVGKPCKNKSGTPVHKPRHHRRRVVRWKERGSNPELEEE